MFSERQMVKRQQKEIKGREKKTEGAGTQLNSPSAHVQTHTHTLTHSAYLAFSPSVTLAGHGPLSLPLFSFVWKLRCLQHSHTPVGALGRDPLRPLPKDGHCGYLLGFNSAICPGCQGCLSEVQPVSLFFQMRRLRPRFSWQCRESSTELTPRPLDA